MELSQDSPGANLQETTLMNSVPTYRLLDRGVGPEKTGRMPAPASGVPFLSTSSAVQCPFTPTITLSAGVIAYVALSPACIRPYLSQPMATPGYPDLPPPERGALM